MPHLSLSIVIRRFPGEQTGDFLPFDLAHKLLELTREYLAEYRFLEAIEQALDACEVNDCEMRSVARSVLASYMGRHGAPKAAAHREVMRTVSRIYRERSEAARWLLAHEAHEDTHPVGDSISEHAFVVEPEFRHPDFEEPHPVRRRSSRIKAIIEAGGQYRLIAHGFGRTKLPPLSRRKVTIRKALRARRNIGSLAPAPQLPLDLKRIHVEPL